MDARAIAALVSAGIAGIVAISKGLTFFSSRTKEQFEKEKALALQEQAIDFRGQLIQLKEDKGKLELSHLALEKEKAELDSRLKVIYETYGSDLDNLVEELLSTSPSGLQNILNLLKEVRERAADETSEAHEKNAFLLKKIEQAENKLEDAIQTLETLPTFAEIGKKMGISELASVWLINDQNRRTWAELSCNEMKEHYPNLLKSEKQYSSLFNDIDRYLGWVAYSLQKFDAVTPPNKPGFEPRTRSSELRCSALTWIRDQRVYQDLPIEESKEVRQYLSMLIDAI